MVDDMESMRGIIKATLKSIGATDIVVAENGYQASKLLAMHNIDLIISD